MSTDLGSEIPVWSIEGYEGRFLTWGGNCWQAFDYRNYRHWFSPPDEPDEDDVDALRRAFKIPKTKMSDSDLVRTPPSVLSAKAREFGRDER